MFSDSVKRDICVCQDGEYFGRWPMPVYDYLCKDCRKVFEKILTLAEYEKQKVTCPGCGGRNVEQEFKSFFAVTSKKS
jgi:putative FmdB family regulatory protein